MNEDEQISHARHAGRGGGHQCYKHDGTGAPSVPSANWLLVMLLPALPALFPFLALAMLLFLLLPGK